MKNGKYWRALDANENFEKVTNELFFEEGKAEIHLLVDERQDQGLGIVRGRGREYALRNGKRLFEAPEIRAEVRSTHAGPESHLGLAWNRIGLADRLHTFIGNGNLLGNPHFVGCFREPGKGLRLFAQAGEPYGERNYSSLVIWKDWKITVEDLAFTAEREGGILKITSVKRSGDGQIKDLKDDILYAFYGQRLVKEGKPLGAAPANLVDEFYDTRHVLLNPYYMGQFDFGMDQLMANPELYLAAFAGEIVSFDTRIMGDRVDLAGLRKALAGKDYREEEPQTGKRGSYRISEDGKTIRMTMHLALYSHNTIGIRIENGKKYVHVVQFPGLSNRAGFGIGEMCGYLAEERKFKDAILLDNGGDVIMFHSKKPSAGFIPGTEGYQAVRGPSEKDRIDNLRMNSIITFVEKEKGALRSPWNNPEACRKQVP
jgi:hypothetical protein